MKFPSTAKNKQLIPQSQIVIPSPIEPTQSKSSKIYLKTLTRTKFIVMKRMNTYTLEESSPDSTTRKGKTSGTQSCFITEKSVQDQTYHSLSLQNSLEISEPSRQLRNLNHQQISIVTHQNYTYITYPGKLPLEVDSLEETLPLHPPYKRLLSKQASKSQHQSKNPEKSILMNKIQIENLLTIYSPQPIQCWQILEILSPRDQLWPSPPPSMETENKLNNSSMKST